MLSENLMKARQWWVSGEEACSRCGGSYTYEVEVRCIGCDHPFCPFCLVVGAKEQRCSECPEEEVSEA